MIDSLDMELAVIKTGGKQYVVRKGDSIFIEKLPAGVKEGDAVTFDQVLMVDDGSAATIGTPTIAGAKVTGKVEREGRAKKIDVVRYKAKSRYLKRRGHRQHYLKVKIDAIS
jgi:large subunit ribosomal protein L21